MDALSVMDIVSSRVTTVDEFNFDNLCARPLGSMLSPSDIFELERIAKSVRYAGKLKLKQQKINDLMHARGFRKLSAGTNRICYTYYEDPSIVVKVAIDDVGATDTPKEFLNQAKLKPFVAKCFEVSPNGVVGVFERVSPITNREEYMTCANDVYDMLSAITSTYVMADIGTKTFMNIGIRQNFGVVLLDYPYMYETDYNHLICKAPKQTEFAGVCGGPIDYDAGFNDLFCTKCGAKYKAVELAKEQDDIKMMFVTKNHRKGNPKMKVGVVINGKKQITNDNNGMKDAVPAIPKPTPVGQSTKVGVKVNVNPKATTTNVVKPATTTQQTTPVQPKPTVQPVAPKPVQPVPQPTQNKPKTNGIQITAISFEKLSKLIFTYKGKADNIGEFVAAADGTNVIVHIDMRTLPIVADSIESPDLEDAKRDLLIQEDKNEELQEKIKTLEADLAELNSKLEIAEDKLNRQNASDEGIAAFYQEKIKELELKNADLAGKIAVLESIEQDVEDHTAEAQEALNELVEEYEAEDAAEEVVEDEEDDILTIEGCHAGIYNMEELAELLKEEFPDYDIVLPDEFKGKRVICIQPNGDTNAMWVDSDNNIKCIGYINGYSLDDITITAKAPVVEGPPYEDNGELPDEEEDGIEEIEEEPEEEVNETEE